MGFIKSYREGLLILYRNIFFLGVILLLLGKFTSIALNDFIPLTFLIILTFFFGFSWLFVYIKRDEAHYKRELGPYFQYFFLFFLFIIAIGSLKFDFLMNLPWFAYLSGSIIRFQLLLTLLTIGLGVLTFYFNRELMKNEIEDEKDAEESAEAERYKEFNRKFPKLTWFNFDYGVNEAWESKKYILSLGRALASPFVWFGRLPYSFVKWMYSEGWVFSIILILIISFFSGVYLYQLGDQYLWSDEVFSFHAAERIISTGSPVYESGLNYTRSSVYHYLLAGSMLLFGENEFGSRVINLFFVMATALLIYYIFRKKSKAFGLLGVLTLLALNFELAMTRETRMYVMLSLMFILSIFSFYNALINKEKMNNQITFFKNKIHFNQKWLILFFIFYFLSLETNPLSIFLLLGLPLYYLIVCIQFNFRKEDVLLGIFFMLLLLSITFYQFHTLNLHTAYFEKTTLAWALNNQINPHAYTDLLKNNLAFYYPGLILLIVLLIAKKDKLHTLFSSIFFVSLYIISYQKQLQERYVYFLFPLIVVLLIYGYYYTLGSFRTKNILKFTFLIIIALLLLSELSLFYKEINEINSYTSDSISQHKKFDFNGVYNYLDNLKIKNFTLITDLHATFTLKEKGYKPDYLLVDKNNVNALLGDKDPYFGIPYLFYESRDFNKIVKSGENVVVIRDPGYFSGINTYFNNSHAVNKPEIFIN